MAQASVSHFASDLSEIACPACGSRRLRRLPRSGFLQKRVYSFFGYYPWECPICRQVRMFRERGKRVRKVRQPELSRSKMG